jgi:hypothetical protein
VSFRVDLELPGFRSDGNVSMEFNRGRGDDMLMSYVPESRTVALARR